MNELKQRFNAFTRPIDSSLHQSSQQERVETGERVVARGESGEKTATTSSLAFQNPNKYILIIYLFSLYIGCYLYHVHVWMPGQREPPCAHFGGVSPLAVCILGAMKS